MKIGIIGGGSWGTALSNVLNDNSHDVTLYIRDKSQIDYINKYGTSCKYLPDFVYPKNIDLTSSMSKAVIDKEVIIYVSPLQCMPEIIKDIKEYISNEAIIVNASKGIHNTSLNTGSKIVSDIIPNEYVILSGPSHAEETSKRLLTSIVCASTNYEKAKIVQDLFSNEYLRVYTHFDVLGIEIASAIKNIIAIGSGILTGMNQGDNAKASLITRGLYEITKLGIKMGCNKETFMGLAGIGDLIVTATSIHSRNYKAGLLIGSGENPSDVPKKIGMVVEGYYTAKSIKRIMEKYDVSMPICSAIYDVLYEGHSPKEVINDLMNREKKAELKEIMD